MRVALGAVQVVVRGVAVIVLVDRPVRQPELAEQPRLDQQPQRPVDRRAAHPAARVMQVGDQLVGVEVLVRVEDMADEDPPRLGQLLAPDLEELAELVFRTIRGPGVGPRRLGSATRRRFLSSMSGRGDSAGKPPDRPTTRSGFGSTLF